MKLVEILPELNSANEREAIELFCKKLISAGYPANRLIKEKPIGAHRKADLAVLSRDGKEVVGIFEFKRGTAEWNRRLREAKDQLLHSIQAISTERSVRAFPVLYGFADGRPSVEIRELQRVGEKIEAIKVEEFPSWEEMTSINVPSLADANAVPLMGKHARERFLVAQYFAVARSELSDLLADLEKIVTTSDAETVEARVRSVLSELELNFQYRFRDLSSPSPWTSDARLFTTVAWFSVRLGELSDALKSESGVAAQTPIWALIKSTAATIERLRNSLKEILAKPSIAKFKGVAAWILGPSPVSTLIEPEGLPKPPPVPQVDVLAITAMDDPEFDALLAVFDPNTAVYLTPFKRANSAVCCIGRISTVIGGKTFSIVAATQNDMGMANAAVLAMKLIHHFKPKYVVMVGIAAGIDPKTQNVGDILVASNTWDLALGKLERSGKWVLFKPKVYQKDVKSLFHHFPSLLQAKKDALLKTEIQVGWNKFNEHKPLPDPPQVHIGPFGSGGSVIADAEEVKHYKSLNGAIIGFDMEAHAIVTAAAECGLDDGVQVLIVKSICDFAGEDKQIDKDYKQQLAAFTSANFMKNFFSKYVFVD